MAKGDKPWGDAFAVVGSGKDAKWIKLSPVWRNEDGSFSTNLEVEPVLWQSPRIERRVQFRKREARNQSNPQQSDAPKDDDE